MHEPHRFRSVGRLADDLEVVLDREDEGEAGPDELLVVDEEHGRPALRYAAWPGRESVARLARRRHDGPPGSGIRTRTR